MIKVLRSANIIALSCLLTGILTFPPASATESQSNLQGSSSISAGRNTCVIDVRGNLICWGNGTARPTRVSGFGDDGPLAVKYVSGFDFSCVLTADQSVYCWGSNVAGQLRRNTYWTPSSSIPIEALSSDYGATNISAGGQHACAIVRNGQIFCWGANSFGQLGLGWTSSGWAQGFVYAGQAYSGPLVAGQLRAAVDIALGEYSSCAIILGGQVACWGRGLHGQLGNGSQYETSSASSITSFIGATQISAGRSNYCALDESSALYCWGQNQYGQIGNNSTVDAMWPEQISVPDFNVSTFKQVSLGEFHSCVLAFDNQAFCWGFNANGMLGTGQPGEGLFPRKVLSLGTIMKEPIQIAAGGSQTCALLVDSQIACWGSGSQLGIGEGVLSIHTPNIVPNFTPAQLPLEPSALSVKLKEGAIWACIAEPENSVGTNVVTGYSYSANNDATWKEADSLDSQNCFQVPELVSDFDFSLRVRASNTFGFGTQNRLILTKLESPKTVPSSPRISSYRVLNHKVFINFIEPQNNGGVQVTNYEYSTDGGSTWTGASPAQTTSPLIISGLTNGVQYSVRIRAVNAVGAGAQSDSVLVTPNTTEPSAPQIQRVGATYKGLHVHFAVPDDDGGAPISGYQYSIDESTWSTVKLIPGVTAFKIPGLSDNRSYSVRMRACNSQGCSSASVPASGTTANIPGAVTIKSISTKARALIVNATIPGNNASPVLRIEYSLDSGSTWQNSVPATRVSPLKIMGLNPNTNYSVRVRAVNRVGAGEGSNLVSVTTLAR